MKIRNIILFITCVYTLLGLISTFFPEEGVTFKATTLTFPNISNVLGQNTENTENIEVNTEISDDIKNYLLAQKESDDYRHKYKALTSPHAISFPNDSIEWMNSVFDEFEKAEKKCIRVIHYGDSQIEEDRITGTLREYLQNTFGGYGVGMVPLIQKVPTSAISQTSNIELDRYAVFNAETRKTDFKDYGPLGQSFILKNSITITFNKLNYSYTQRRTKKFGNITILFQSDYPLTATAFVNNKPITATSKIGDTKLNIDIPDSTTNISLTINGNAIIFGIMVDGNGKGIQVDNAAMRGCSGTIFTSISSSSLSTYYSKNNVPLIIMQYGGNSMPYIKSTKQIESYCKNISRQFRYLKKISPKSKILFIGPSDMVDRTTRQTYSHMEEFIDSLKSTCFNNDVAYWDLYKNMGGNGSMTQWVNNKLAGTDYIHFSREGSKKAGLMLCDGIQSAYEYYIYKKESSLNIEENEQAQTPFKSTVNQ